MRINDLTGNITHLADKDILVDWRWLIRSSEAPVSVTIAGDAFLQDRETGAVRFLDTVEGTVEEVAATWEDFERLLSDNDFVMDYFAVRLVGPLLQSGKRPEPGQVFSFKKLPVLGGEYDQSNLESTDVEVHFSLLGQIWNQVSELPEGTPINSVDISSD